ncbi:putative reverse transcriptase domain-containing protein [Tanacetum coccineum]
MDLHVVSRICHHPDGLVHFSKGSDDMSGYIVSISRPSNKVPGTEVTEGLFWMLSLWIVFLKPSPRNPKPDPITMSMCIPHGCRLAFSQTCIGPRIDKNVGPGIENHYNKVLYLSHWLCGGKDDGITTLVKSILDGSALGSFGQGGGDFLEEGAMGNTNIKQCLRKVADGHFTAVVKVLSSSGVTPYCDDTIKALEAKHPYKTPPSMPSITFFEPPLVAKIDNVFKGSATATDLLKVITPVVNLWLAGRYSPILAEFVASAPLTPLLKPDNGIRTIAVGTIWSRLVSKVAMKGVGKEMSKYLSDFQFGVRVSGGAEAILHGVNRVFSEYHNEGSLAMLTMDFSNAFNLVDKSALLHEVRVKCPSISLWVNFLYGQTSRLYIGDTHIWSAIGVQQGDPLGPLLFALILHPLLHKIKDSCKLLLHAWYLDDGTVIGDSKEVSRPSSGVKLLGGAVSRDADFISGLAMRRATNAVNLMGFLSQLHDPQSELLLLRSYHIVRDSGICGMDGDYVSALACLHDTIPSFDFGGFTNKDTVPSKAQQTLTNVLFSEMVKDMEVHFDMTMRQKAECLRAPHAQDFLLAIPIYGLGQHMSPVEYRTILKYRLMIPLFPVDAICPVCHKACLDSFAEHAVHCKELPGFKY